MQVLETPSPWSRPPAPSVLSLATYNRGLMDSPPALPDRWGRPLANLRISVTDRCNLRCAYCMPEAEYAWLPHASLLRFEELAELAGIFAGLGVRRLRLTGGEPLMRRD